MIFESRLMIFESRLMNLASEKKTLDTEKKTLDTNRKGSWISDLPSRVRAETRLSDARPR